MLAILKREFLSYFKSPVGYVAIALFSFLSGFIFVMSFGNAYSNITSEIIRLCGFFVVLVPIVTMGLLADDKRRGTDVIYYTSPIKLTAVVLGKFLAAVGLFVVMFINIVVHMIVTKAYGGVIDASVFTAVVIYFSIVLLYVSIGLFASSISDSQIVAAIVAFVFIMIIQLLPTIGSFVSSAVTSLLSILGNPSSATLNSVSQKIINIFVWLDPNERIDTTSLGIFNLVSVFYCLSFAFFFLFLTYRMLEKKRWTQS